MMRLTIIYPSIYQINTRVSTYVGDLPPLLSAASPHSVALEADVELDAASGSGRVREVQFFGTWLEHFSWQL